MKPILLIQLLPIVLALTLPASVRAEIIDFSWWDTRYETPGLFSSAAGGYSRDARFPDEAPIQVVNSDSDFTTNRDVTSVFVVPPGTEVFSTNIHFTARAQSDFGKNHAQTRTLTTGFAESEDRQYFDSRSHSMIAESIWADQWTFTGPGLGTAAVTLSAGFEVDISNSPCPTGDCGVSLHPAFDRYEFKAWWYRIYGALHVFDLDVIDEVYQPDSDDYPEVPREVASFVVFRQGENSTRDFFSPIEPFTVMPNWRLAPVHTNGSLSFVPVAGHRYRVAGRIQIQSREGADVNAFHTLSLDKVILGQGLRLHSVAGTNGAQFNVLVATSLTLTRTAGEVTLSFPSATEFTYHVEYKTAFDAPLWTPLATRTGDGGAQNVIDSNAGGSARFYRLRVE
jgi:hypothetical protein